MNKILFLLLLILSARASAQKGFIYLGPTLSFPQTLGTAFGGQIGLGVRLAPALYVGASVEIDKAKNLKKAYVPLAANFTFLPNGDKGGAMVTFQPGYGFYNAGAGNAGGFTMFVGAGGVTPKIGKTRAFVNLGYQMYSIGAQGVSYDVGGYHAPTTHYGGVAIKAGIMFQ